MNTCIHITFIAVILILVSVSLSYAADGDCAQLHSATLYSWHKAPFENKMASATDWVRSSVSVESMDDLKGKAFGLVMHLDKLAEKESARYAKNTKVFNAAIIGMAECEYRLK
jgi:hypothetical protein